MTAPFSPLHRAGIALECAAATLNAVAQRLEAPEQQFATIGDFVTAQERHQLARDVLRAEIETATGQPHGWIERMLTL